MQRIFALLLVGLLISSCAVPIITQKEPQEPAAPETPPAASWYSRGISANDPEQRIEYFSHAIRQKPDFTSAYIARGNAYLETNQPDSAVSDFSIALEQNPDSYEAYVQRGKAYEIRRHYHAAIEDYSRAIKLNPQVSLFLNRANCYTHRRRYSLAIVDYSKALELDPDNPDVLIARGVAYQKLNQHAKAAEDYKKALRFKSEDADLYYNIGSIYWVQGDWDQVIKYWEKCLDLDPDHPRVRQYLPVARKKARGIY